MLIVSVKYTMSSSVRRNVDVQYKPGLEYRPSLEYRPGSDVIVLMAGVSIRGNTVRVPKTLLGTQYKIYNIKILFKTPMLLNNTMYNTKHYFGYWLL